MKKEMSYGKLLHQCPPPPKCTHQQIFADISFQWSLTKLVPEVGCFPETLNLNNLLSEELVTFLGQFLGYLCHCTVTALIPVGTSGQVTYIGVLKRGIQGEWTGECE